MRRDEVGSLAFPLPMILGTPSQLSIFCFQNPAPRCNRVGASLSFLLHSFPVLSLSGLNYLPLAFIHWSLVLFILSQISQANIELEKTNCIFKEVETGPEFHIHMSLSMRPLDETLMRAGRDFLILSYFPFHPFHVKWPGFLWWGRKSIFLCAGRWNCLIKLPRTGIEGKASRRIEGRGAKVLDW